MSQGAVQASVSEGGATRGTPANEASTLIGTTLDGAYRITRLIAEGGMSAVYEATQLRLNQQVAVKVMARELASNQEALARFQREAEITSRLRHPHLVTVMDFGTAPTGQPYLVMEYLEGIDLDRRIDQVGRIPLAAAVHITKQAASALAAAHEQGIVHRDLKPANVFLVELPGEPDFTKILDFGISKVKAAGTQLTKAQAIIGTPNYMSPEQATGMLDEIDHRTDQWALACIVWEMLSGRATFASDDMSAVFYQVIHLDPRPLRAPDLPAAVEAVLRRALSKQAADRFPSIRDFSNALAEAAQPPAPVARHARRATPTGEARLWVERRQGRRERRRPDVVAPVVRAAGPTSGQAVTAPVRTTFWRKLKPVHALPALTVALAVVAVALLRWNPSVTAAVPATVPVILPPAVVAPAPVPGEPHSPAATAEEAARAPRTGKPKSAEAEAPVPGPTAPPEPMRRSGKHPVPKAGRGADDGIDPFAPARSATLHRPARPATADRDFVDPFGP